MGNTTARRAQFLVAVARQMFGKEAISEVARELRRPSVAYRLTTELRFLKEATVKLAATLNFKPFKRLAE